MRSPNYLYDEDGLLCHGAHIQTLWTLFFSQYSKFTLTRIEGLKTEDIVQCTDCTAYWGIVIVIF